MPPSSLGGLRADAFELLRTQSCSLVPPDGSRQATQLGHYNTVCSFSDTKPVEFSATGQAFGQPTLLDRNTPGATLKKLKHFSTLTWASASQRANGIQHVLCHAKTVQKHYASLWQNRVRWGKTKFITPPERPCAPTLVTRLNLCGQQDSLYASQNNPNNDAHS